MKNNTKRILSFALAGTIVSGAQVCAHANEEIPNKTQIATINNETIYTVKEGDTLGKICAKYYGNAGYYELLAEYNHLENPNVLSIGEKLVIPNSLLELMNVEYTETYEDTNYPPDKTYTVKTGDTLYCIVNVMYGLTNQEAVDKLATYNNLSDPNRISLGQVLLIPCVEKLNNVVQNDYTDEYNRMGYILNHMNDEPSVCIPEQPPIFPWWIQYPPITEHKPFCKTLKP